MNKNWIRWIYISIINNFENVREDIPVYYDRVNRETDWAEVRMDGPHIRELSNGFFRIDVAVSALVTSYIGNYDYQLQRMLGMLSLGFDDICCYRYGDGDEDDASLLGILKPLNGFTVVNFGLISPESRFRRSQIEATFRMTLP